MEFNEYYSAYLKFAYHKPEFNLVDAVFTFRRYPNLNDLYIDQPDCKILHSRLAPLWEQFATYSQEALSEIVINILTEESRNEVHSKHSET